MYIPFGKREPNQQEKSLLEKIGFDKSKIIHYQERYFYLQIPIDSRIKCQSRKLSDYRTTIDVSFNDMNVISINLMQVTGHYEIYADLKLNKINILKIAEIHDKNELLNHIINSYKVSGMSAKL